MEPRHKGLTWDHPRGYRAIESIAAGFAASRSRVSETIPQALEAGRDGHNVIAQLNALNRGQFGQNRDTPS